MKEPYITGPPGKSSRTLNSQGPPGCSLRTGRVCLKELKME